jgi:hypothetical protein
MSAASVCGNWLRRVASVQFAALGCKRDKAEFATHLLAVLQGVSLLANCFRDQNLFLNEGERLKSWIDTI